MEVLISSLLVIVIYTSFIFEMKNAYKHQLKRKDYFSVGLLSVFVLAPLPVVLNGFSGIYNVVKGLF